MLRETWAIFMLPYHRDSASAWGSWLRMLRIAIKRTHGEGAQGLGFSYPSAIL